MYTTYTTLLQFVHTLFEDGALNGEVVHLSSSSSKDTRAKEEGVVHLVLMYEPIWNSQIKNTK
jgi:hypothetical protein